MLLAQPGEVIEYAADKWLLSALNCRSPGEQWAAGFCPQAVIRDHAVELPNRRSSPNTSLAGTECLDIFWHRRLNIGRKDLGPQIGPVCECCDDQPLGIGADHRHRIISSHNRQMFEF